MVSDLIEKLNSLGKKPKEEWQPLIFFIEKWDDSIIARIDKAVRDLFQAPMIQIRDDA